MLRIEELSDPSGAQAKTCSSPAVALLSPAVAGKIAAGECVERPASVVKELVENALDAGATRITVEMGDGGRALIRITDNGHGMSREDMVLAVQRHATSKLRDLDDLSNIYTLGFRGEALPSIAAVSRLEIISGMPDAEPNQMLMEGSEILDLCGCGAPTGTTVCVRDLFFNTPARLKFLRSAQTEFGHALEHLTRLAISHHKVAFRVLHNGREALNTPGSPDALNAIVAAYGPDTARLMVSVDLHAPPFRIKGYVSRPALTRSNRSQQSFFVNRRWVRNRTLGHALDHAYRTLLTVGRHPISAILIELSSELVDVNVHPTKAEVRFLRDWEVHQVVARAIKDALLAQDLVPQVSLGKTNSHASNSQAPGPGQNSQASLWKQPGLFGTPGQDRFSGCSPAPTPMELPWADSSTSGSGSSTGTRLPTGSSQDFHSFESEGRVWQAPVRTSSEGDDAPGAFSGAGEPGQPEGSPFEGGLAVWESEGSRSPMAARECSFHEGEFAAACGPLAEARIVGQIHRCYIMAETPQGLVLVDQHAAHERILYERFLQRGGGRRVQQLVVPLTLTLGHREAALTLDRLEDFFELGFQMEPFGPNTFLVRTVPILDRRQNYVQLLRDLVDELTAADFGRRMRLQRERIAASMACRAAIKQGDLLSPAEMEALFSDLRGVDAPLEVPTNCPHGRPTTILLTLSQIEKLFHRT